MKLISKLLGLSIFAFVSQTMAAPMPTTTGAAAWRSHCSSHAAHDVRPLLAACDTVALCSTAVETFSLAALEAMALGRPVVLSDIGGAAEMVRPGVEGFLFPAGDTAALVGRLAALADADVRSPMGAAARETVLARFSEDAMVERYEALLQELVLTRRQREDLRRSAAAH